MEEPADDRPTDGLLRRVARGLGGAAGRAVRSLAWPFRRSSHAPPARPLDAPPPAGRTAGPRERDRSRPPDPSQLASAEGLESLTRALADPDPAVRALALEVVSEFSGDRAARVLGGMLQDPEPGVRRAAATAATRVRSSAVVFSLILALEDADPTVQDAAASAIETIGGRPIDRAGLNDPVAAGRMVEELKVWWKDRRLAELARAADL